MIIPPIPTPHRPNQSTGTQEGVSFPFSAFLGYSVARRALLCALIDPTLRGVIVSGPVGSGKSALLRSFGAFARAHVDPTMPFTQIPLGVTDDRLIGGIDLEATLAAGAPRWRAGLLAQAHGGLLFVDDLPLLPSPSAAIIAQALDSGRLLCEREGVSRCSPADMVLLATTVPSERDVSISFADRVAFLIAQERRISSDSAGELIRRLEWFARDPQAMRKAYEQAELGLARQVTQGRLLHGLVALGADTLGAVVEASQTLNITGSRADIFAVKAARAHAALRGSRVVEEEDLRFAVATVLAPRSQNVPDEDHDGNDGDSTPEEGTEGNDNRNEGEGTDRREFGGGGDNGTGVEEGRATESNGESPREQSGRFHEQIFNPLDFNAPLVDLGAFFLKRQSAQSGGRGQSNQWNRGRHTRSIQTEASGKRIAVGATLRAAAPHQKERRSVSEQRVVVRGEDLRIKKFTERAGTLFIFCVDSSGSMAMNRMREAKGAVTKLLQNAYVNRDTVALIGFRGTEAEILLPPTGSVERAKRSLDILPTGGGTPLAAALLKAYAMTERARRGGIEQSLVIMLTDGRANVPIAENAAGMIMEIRRNHVRDEIERIAESYRRANVAALVIDTKQHFGANSDAVRLAETLGARYYFLPRIDAHGIASVVEEAVGRRR